jgi:hypothetical protein
MIGSPYLIILLLVRSVKRIESCNRTATFVLGAELRIQTLKAEEAAKRRLPVK